MFLLSIILKKLIRQINKIIKEIIKPAFLNSL